MAYNPTVRIDLVHSFFRYVNLISPNCFSCGMKQSVQVSQADPVVVDQIQRTDAGPDKRFHRISAHTADPKLLPGIQTGVA